MALYSISVIVNGIVIVIIIVVLLSRDAMQVRPMPSCSVCPSVTCVKSVKTNNHILRHFYHQVAKPF